MHSASREIELTECPLCLNSYTEPKLLPCAHVMCRDCLVTYLKTNAKALCPQCRSAIVNPNDYEATDIEDFVYSLCTDLSMAVRVESVKALHEKRVCHVHSDVAATSLCLHCGVMLCQACTKVHSTLPVTFTHTVEDLTTPTPERLVASRRLTCTAHPHKTSEFFCTDHSAYVCLQCATSTHGTCLEVTSLCEMGRKYKQSLLEIETGLSVVESDFMTVMTKFKEQLLTFIRNVRATTKDTNETCRDLILSVETCRKQLLTSIQDTERKITSTAIEQIEVIGQTRSQLTSHLLLVDRVQQLTDSRLLAVMGPEVKRRIAKLNIETSLLIPMHGLAQRDLTVDLKGIVRVERELDRIGKLIVSTAAYEQCTEEEAHADYETKQTDETDFINDLHQTRTELNQTKAELHETKTELPETKRELDETKRELDETKTELDETKRELDETKRELDETKTELDKTKTELDETKRELDEIKTELDETRRELDETKTELQETKTDLQETTTELQETKTELQETKTELQETKRELQNIRNAYTLEQENVSVLSLLKSECQKCLDLENALEKEAKAKASLEEKVRELEARLRDKVQLPGKRHTEKLEMKTTDVRLEDLDKTELLQGEFQTENALRDGLEFQIYKPTTGLSDGTGCSDTMNTKASSTLKDISRSTGGNICGSTVLSSETVEFKEDTLKSGTDTNEDVSISGITNESLSALDTNDQKTAPHFSDSWQMSATFTNQGGQLKGKHSDVVLYVPENAIRASTDVTIHGAVSTDLEAVHKALSLDKTETIVSPVAEYSLGGEYTGFTKALWVILPHFLTKSFSLECVRVYRFDKSTSGLFTLQRLQPQHSEVDKTTEKFEEQSEYFFVMDDKRICAVVSHFTGFFCAQCRRDLEPFQLELSLYGIHRQRNNIEVNIALFVWDGRLQIKDFEKTFLRGQFKELKYITNGQLDPAPNEKEISLGMEMVMSASTKKTWRHLEMEGNQVSPTATKRNLENMYVQSDCRSHTLNQHECSHQYTEALCNNCFYNRKPIRIDWTLEGKQGATPTAWFQCAIRVGYIRAFNPTSLNFLEEVMLQTLNVHGLEVEEKVNAGVQTDLCDSVETHVQKLAEAPATEETRSQLIEDASYQADNQHAVISSIPNTSPTSVVNVNIKAFHGQLDLSSNTKLRAQLSTDEEAHQMSQPSLLSSLVCGMRENPVSSPLEQKGKSLFVSSETDVPDAEEPRVTRPTLHARRTATPSSREVIHSTDLHTVGGQGAACRNLSLLSAGSEEQRLHSTPTQFHTTFDTTGDNYRETSMSGFPIGHDVTSQMTDTYQTTLLKESTKDDDGNVVVDEAVNKSNDPQI